MTQSRSPDAEMNLGAPLDGRPKISARITAAAGMEVLSRQEVARLVDSSSAAHELFRRCAMAVMNTGADTDDAREVMRAFADFDVQVVQQDRGIKLEVVNAPPSAFVDGVVITGIRELLFAVLRDVVYVTSEIESGRQFDLADSEGITNAVFAILRNAGVLKPNVDPTMVVCWGGHSINRVEYDYTKVVGYELGLRGLDICTGCGPGAMKGPMKGATIAHSKQRRAGNRYLGITEPGIIAAEPPNPIVNQLVIMPDIEKRLEAFVRAAHGIVVFPGGVGTAEEILYLLGILLHPENEAHPLPVVLTGPRESADYFERIDEFIGATLGSSAQSRYQIVVGDAEEVAQRIVTGIGEVREHRKSSKDAFFFNWGLRIQHSFQQPFSATHEAMAGLALHSAQEGYSLAANLRRAFSGIVAGNVKADGMEQIARHGPFRITGEADLMHRLDDLLRAFVSQRRMKLPGAKYVPCYEVLPAS